MFDLGMSELLVIGIVALIVIGPKDLPELFRTLGRFTAKMRSMAREFSRAMEAAADESGVKDVAKDVKAMTSAKSLGLDAVKDAATKFEKWDPLKPAASSAPVGPATQALKDAQVTRKAIVREAVDKLKKPDAAVPAASPMPAPAAAHPPAPPPVKKPRAPRKPKAAVAAGEAPE
ncbi:MAG: twin-arginine translocase subunit TatB [Tabrizicola sp.]|nr:twin-arginine translocase subunit TatB [Tabrizicola sp.]